MPWCPKCRNEYREGILECAECKVALVDSLEEAGQTLKADEWEQSSDIFFMQDDGTDDADETGEADFPEERKVYHAYRDSAEEAEENRASAYMLLVIGGIGFIVDLLVFSGTIPVSFDSAMTKYFLCGVMGAMFLLFIVLGVVSMRSSRWLLVKAETEGTLTGEITKWCEENLSAAGIDAGLPAIDSMQEEQKYFLRAEKMKECISGKFLNLDDAFLEHFVDGYYQKLFEEKETF